MGSDLGGALKGFKDSMQGDDDDAKNIEKKVQEDASATQQTEKKDESKL